MTVTQIELAQIVAQASSFSELLQNQLSKLDAIQVSEQQISAKRLAHWCEVVAQGNWKKFLLRLQWDELDIEVVRYVLGGQPQANIQALPSWAETLREIIQTTSSFKFQNVTQYPSQTEILKSKLPITPENPLPFEDVLLPAISVARQKLLTRLGACSLSPSNLPLEQLSETAYFSLERSLLQKLINLCGKTLEFEFSHSRPIGYSLLELLMGEVQSNNTKVYYNTFVDKLLQDGLLAFFQKYPVLGRLVATVIDFWVEATVEFLQRLKTDICEIQQIYNHSTEVGKATDIKLSLSDPHNCGRSVIILTFESGMKLVYKPRNLELEVAYSKLLEWCNQQAIPLSFKVLKVLNRRNYGWVEYVEQQPCKEEAEAQRFYQRAGMLLCLLYTLRTNDCHHENLIANGEHLVLVDMETLMQHQAKPIADHQLLTEADTTVKEIFSNSVLRTGLLPYWVFDKDKRISYDISGLGSVSPQEIPWRSQRLKFVNTDDMHLVYETVTKPVAGNVPTMKGVALCPNDYLEELVSGFKQMYRFLTEKRDALLATDSPLTIFQGLQARFIFRATHIYGFVLQNTLVPEFLRHGIDRSIELDILSRAFVVTQDNKPNAWAILQAETRAMEQLDIPYFEVNTDSADLSVGLEQPIKNYLKERSYNEVITQLQKLNETDLAQQVAIIQGAFYARVAQTPESAQETRRQEGNKDYSQINPLTKEQLLQEASRIAQEIQKHAIVGADGSIHWIGLSYVINAQRFQFQPLGNSIYEGNFGIALFLAALDYVRGTTQFHDLVLGALQSLRNFLDTPDTNSLQRLTQQIGIGAGTGVASMIYSLVRISQFLADTKLLEDARRFANLITPQVIAADQSFDVTTGTAGGILGLLALYNQTGEPGVLDKAICCGQHLLKNRISIDDCPRAWKTIAEKPSAGLSHGTAGIALALLHLYGTTHDKDYLEAACEGIAYEHSIFSKAAQNWPDYRAIAQRNGQFKFMASWCNGAPGIGLARLGGLSILNTEEIHQDVEVALQATINHSLQDVDFLCCGNFGRFEVLLVAAQKLSRPLLREIAQQRAACVIARAEQIGAYELFTDLPKQVFNLSFFQGTSGIGYELLRLAYPERLPSVLLWE
ncbi:hypothetical protein DSM106972_014680 [Dulcicalothrix desertica PCC 7102]|uniref:Lantibiotic biosynthesis protein dehydration domain-containing protein n=1 Tax=Dulcicalothrix desertica PCC 7102 TaxID=232991 RepID=A0A3S1DE36_9CYAN|nr:type 2 lanthipeptide synthetase LanM family protein [Dulcicalothrix desertica]RUT08300.1 hypothetical protein DSM106972_014680 [Dulcicalothrix desertica PCC 7102]TWH40166.1 type 2 lantibiotic biosynthesis protein LanM [Dulcicalothrix desertica PCC 7102]